LDQASVLGLAKVIALEYPELQCASIDVDSADGVDQLLAHELTGNDNERHVALRDRRRYVPRLIRDSTIAAGSDVRGDSTYLITGAFGGLGLPLARWLVDRGARHLVLIGRKAPRPHVAEELGTLRARGVQVIEKLADVADARRVAAIFAEIEGACPPLRGIVHAAAVFDDGLLAHQSWDRFENVLAPKVYGAWNLHELTENLTLDFFILFSSVASVFGWAGQGNYAAANASLDSLALYRRAKGLPALSINWGPWTQVGVAAARNREGRFNLHGLGSIPPEKGFSILGQLLSASGQVVVAPVNWSLFAKTTLSQELAVVSPAAPRRHHAANAPIDEDRSAIERIINGSRGRAVEQLVSRIRSHTAQLLGHDAASLEAASRPFSDVLLPELGMDSLSSNDLRNLLWREFGVDVPLTRILGETVRSIADGLYDGLLIRRVSNGGDAYAEITEDRETFVF
jgi:acyl carrier protein